MIGQVRKNINQLGREWTLLTFSISDWAIFDILNGKIKIFNNSIFLAATDFGNLQRTNSQIYSMVDMKILIIMMDLAMSKIGKFNDWTSILKSLLKNFFWKKWSFQLVTTLRSWWPIYDVGNRFIEKVTNMTKKITNITLSPTWL